jgi:hypothetical protein
VSDLSSFPMSYLTCLYFRLVSPSRFFV